MLQVQTLISVAGFVKGLGRITRGKTKRRGREKRRGEAEKDESQGEKKKEREKSYDIGSVCGSHYF